MKRFFLYFFLSFISNLCLICNVSALTYNGNLIEVNSSHYHGSTLFEYNNISTFVYDNYYYSDAKDSNDFYRLGYHLQNFPQTNLLSTNNINFYMEKPCSASDNLSYNLILRFYKVAGSQDFNFSRLPVVLGNKGCSGFWQKNGDNWDYVLSCNLQPDNYVVGSLTFDYTNLGIPSGAYYDYRIAIQKNFDYSCTINSQSIIENNNINSQNIIDNQNNNTQSIIDNQNSNTQAQIDSQKSCTTYFYDDATNVNKMLNPSGLIVNNNNYSLTDYIDIVDTTVINTVKTGSGFSGYYCFYDSSKTKISCSNISDIEENTEISLPTNAHYIRISISKNYKYPNFKICKNGNQAITDTLTSDEIDDNKISDILDDLQDSYTSTESFGAFSGFIQLPLTWVQQILDSSNACTPIHLPLPFLDRYLDLPCMGDFWDSLGLLSTLVTLTWVAVVAVRIFNGLFVLVTWAKDPDPDKDFTLLKTWEL